MTTKPASSPNSARNPAPSGRPPQAAGGLKQLLEQMKAQAERASESTRQLNQQIDSKMSQRIAKIEHVYGVFQVGPPHRLMVLRDVEELNGKKPRYSTPDFSAAMQFASQRLVDPVFPAHPPLDWDLLLRALSHLARIIDHIEAGNARLTGSGTAAEPYVASGPLHARAPLTLNFSAPPANLSFTADGRVLRVATAASSP